MIGKMDDGVGFMCLVCQRVVLHKGNLKKHIVSMHIGESPQECTICGKSFKNLNSLQNHTSIHHRGDRCIVSSTVGAGKITTCMGGVEQVECAIEGSL